MLLKKQSLAPNIAGEKKRKKVITIGMLTSQHDVFSYCNQMSCHGMDGLVCCGLVICIFTLVYNNVCMYVYIYIIIYVYNNLNHNHIYIYMYIIYSQGLSIVYSIHMVIVQILRPWESHAKSPGPA